ncbi:MAG: FtsQ-type POTRA domain-containing protein [Alphaproteobacteria bacterium]|nr:FtsQ-type POTRA domain-containing protein [Alphaproteobacteria bacterium]
MRRVKQKKSFLKSKTGMGIFVLIMLTVGGFFLRPYIQMAGEKVREFYRQTTEKADLILEQITVEGRNRTGLDELNKALSGVEKGMPIFDISLTEIQEKTEALPWVKTAVIERHWPSTLYIRIVEKTPIAVWQNNKKYLPLDEDGKPIPDSETHLPDNLILVVGQDAPARTPALLKALNNYPDIREKVRSAVRIGQRRWNLNLNEVDGITVQLPEVNIDSALSRLNTAIERDKILKRDLQLIDLRLAERVRIQLKERK